VCAWRALGEAREEEGALGFAEAAARVADGEDNVDLSGGSVFEWLGGIGDVRFGPFPNRVANSLPPDVPTRRTSAKTAIVHFHSASAAPARCPD
jgi:hypothetical protein